MRAMSLSLPGGGVPRSIRGIGLYAGIAILGTAFLFFLHFLGNQTPHALIQERIAAEAETDQATSILQSPISRKYEYCTISSLALAGSKRDESYHPLRDAIILRDLERSWFHWCRDVARGSLDDAPEPTVLPSVDNTRYWYGAKAIYVISIRWVSAPDFYKFMRLAIYASYALLGLSLLSLGTRRFLAGLPIVIAGLFFVANDYYSDIVIGLPHLWTAFSIAVLILLFRWDRTSRLISIFCFIIGMISSYFWLFDGHTILAMPAIGLAGWLGYYHKQPRERARRSLAMLGLYIAGFALCFILSQTAKSVVWEWPDLRFSDSLFLSVIEHTQENFERTASESLSGINEGNNAGFLSCFSCGQGWKILPVIRELRIFPALVPGHISVGKLLGFFSGLALVLAISAAIIQTYRGHTRAMWSASWILVLLLLLCIQFILPDDAPPRSFRMISFALALCWSAFALVMITLTPKEKLIATGCLISGCFLITVIFLMVWEIERSRLRSIIDNNDPVLSEDFDVYHHDNLLIYTKESCNSSLSMPVFALHIFPEHEANLYHGREEHFFNNRDFFFRSIQSAAMNCTAVFTLPDYGIYRIETGQFTSSETIWSGTILLSWGPSDQNSLRHLYTIESIPVFESDWDIFITDSVIVYYREECALRDVVDPFFLHIFPTTPTDLPERDRNHGFENRDFLFTGFDRDNRRIGIGARVGEDCIAVRDLPSYDIASIETGQYSYGVSQRKDKGQLWRAVIDPARK